MWFLISWLLQKPADPDLRCLQEKPAQGLPWLRICCSQHFSQMEKVVAKSIDFSQGFSQKVVSRSCSVFNFLPASGNFCHLLITFASSLNPGQALQNVGPDLDPNCLTPWWYWKRSSIQRVKDDTIIKSEEIIKAILENPKADQMKKVNKQCLLDTPRTVRVSEKTWQVIVRTRRP